MTTSPFPPPSTASVPEPYSLTHLDQLLTTYLTLLDTYTTQRDALSKDLSTGFFSLAQAQRSAMLPPGQRYGEEMYDGRMRAGRWVHAQGTKVEISAFPPDTKTAQTSSINFEDKVEPDKPEEPAAEREHEQEQEKPNPPTQDAPPTKSQPSTTKSTDPLRWFGVLTPAPLRSSQSSFVSAVRTIPTLITTSREMAALEGEIERVREALGLNEKRTERDIVVEEEEDIEREEDPKTAKSSKRRSLASRGKVAEPRSRVLKLGN